MTTFDRFNFEQQLLRIWSLTDQLDSITEATLEHDWTKDQITNATIGLKQLLDFECQKVFGMFEEGVRSRCIV